MENRDDYWDIVTSIGTILGRGNPFEMVVNVAEREHKRPGTVPFVKQTQDWIQKKLQNITDDFKKDIGL